MFQLIALLVLVGNSVSKPMLDDVRIVGGLDIEITAAPYQVSLINRGTYSCGGTIIANDLIVTAAHCVVGSSASNLQIRAGSSYSSRGGEIYKVGDFVWNRNYTYTDMDSDVALLWLAKPLRFNNNISPIDMYESGEEIKNGELSAVTGWGNLKEGGGFPSTLQMVLVPIVSPETCNTAYAPLYKITKNMICAGVIQGGKDACQGDSGGPLVHNGKLAGVVSWGLGCARPKFPGVYAKISALRKWIDEQAMYLRIKNNVIIRRLI